MSDYVTSFKNILIYICVCVSITIRISFKKYTSSIIVKENFSSNVYTAVAKIIFVGLL